MTVSLVVPLALHTPERERNWAWLRTRYTQAFPTWELLEAPDPGTDGDWSKGRAVNAAARKATTDVLVIADADLVIDSAELERATTLAAWEAPWVVPHGNVYRLNDRTTKAFATDRDPLTVTVHEKIRRDSLVRRIYTGPAGGGLVVVRRDAFLEVGGFDERFHGWGGEDISLAAALDTLVGDHHRIGVPAWHLWHLGAPRRAHARTNDPLAGRYRRARGDAPTMRAIVAERTEVAA